MAAATVQSQSSFVETSRPSGSNVLSSVREKPHDVHTTLNFVKVMPDGSHLAPNYVGRPETYDRPVEALPVTIHDVSGRELEYTLDSHGFQFYYHESQTKNFDDNDQVRSEYYPETEQLLKDAYVADILSQGALSNQDFHQNRCFSSVYFRSHYPATDQE